MGWAWKGRASGCTRRSTSKSIALWDAWGQERSPRTAKTRGRGPGGCNGAEQRRPKDPQLQKLRGYSFRKTPLKKKKKGIFFVHMRNDFPPYNQLYIPVLLTHRHCAAAVCNIQVWDLESKRLSSHSLTRHVSYLQWKWLTKYVRYRNVEFRLLGYGFLLQDVRIVVAVVFYNFRWKMYCIAHRWFCVRKLTQPCFTYIYVYTHRYIWICTHPER